MSQNSLNGSQDKDELLVDYLEGELDESSASSVKTLLRHSTLDNHIVSNLSKTRDAVKVLDSVELPESKMYFDYLHDSIMAAIEKTEIERPQQIAAEKPGRTKAL